MQAEIPCDQRESLFQGGLPRRIFAKAVVGVKRTRYNLLWKLWLPNFFSIQFLRRNLSAISSSTTTPVPKVGVITRSTHAIVWRPYRLVSPTLPMDASLSGPSSNCVLHAADQASALRRLFQ